MTHVFASLTSTDPVTHQFFRAIASEPDLRSNQPELPSLPIYPSSDVDEVKRAMHYALGYGRLVRFHLSLASVQESAGSFAPLASDSSSQQARGAREWDFEPRVVLDAQGDVAWSIQFGRGVGKVVKALAFKFLTDRCDGFDSQRTTVYAVDNGAMFTAPSASLLVHMTPTKREASVEVTAIAAGLAATLSALLLVTRLIPDSDFVRDQFASLQTCAASHPDSVEIAQALVDWSRNEVNGLVVTATLLLELAK